jgi:hypothetical protein
MAASRTLMRRSSELEVILYYEVFYLVIVRQINTNERYINIIDGQNPYLNVIIANLHWKLTIF